MRTPRDAEESRRERNVLIQNTLNIDLQAAFTQATLAEMSAAPDVRLLDEAKVPLEPVTDQLVIIILAGFAGGLGLTILGTLPLMKAKKGGAADPEQAAQLLESTRSIRIPRLRARHGGHVHHNRLQPRPRRRQVLPSGTRFAGGPELLASPVMAQFLMGLRSEYQAIILDSPPLGAGVTDRELAQTRMHDIDRLPIRMLGAILNDVSTHGMYKYYGYTPGYRAEDEGVEDPPEAAGKKSPLRRLTGA